MTTYYVRKTGNDTTGDGSTGNPWLTVSKALLTVSIAGGHTIKVGDGTYQESTSGLGYLYINRAFSAEVIIESEGGVAANVILQGATSTSFDIRVAGLANHTFKNLTIAGRTTSNVAVIKCQDATGWTNLKFDGCIINGQANNGVCFNATAAAGTPNGLTFIGCTLNYTGVIAHTGIRVQVVMSNVTITNTTITQSGSCINLSVGGGVTTLVMTDVTCTTTLNSVHCVWLDRLTGATITRLNATSNGTASVACLVGADAETGNASSNVVISGGTYTAVQSHALLIGAAVNVGSVTGATVNGGDQGLVFKCAANFTATNCTCSVSVSGHAAYFKGAQTCSITNCVITASVGYCFGLGATGTTLATGNTFTNNRCTASGTGQIFNWVTAEDGGGNVCDYNTYSPAAGGFGIVRGDASVANLAELIAAWSGYDVAGNDTHSGLPSSDSFTLLMMRRHRR